MGAGRRSTSWALADAKARFSELVDRATHDGPQTITRNGKPTAVVMSVDEWQRRTRRRGNLAEFLAASPLPNSRLDVRRLDDLPRDSEL